MTLRTSHTTSDPGGSAGYHKDGSAPRKCENDGTIADTAAPKIGESNISSTNLGANKPGSVYPRDIDPDMFEIQRIWIWNY